MYVCVKMADCWLQRHLATGAYSQSASVRSTSFQEVNDMYTHTHTHCTLYICTCISNIRTSLSVCIWLTIKTSNFLNSTWFIPTVHGRCASRTFLDKNAPLFLQVSLSHSLYVYICVCVYVRALTRALWSEFVIFIVFPPCLTRLLTLRYVCGTLYTSRPETFRPETDRCTRGRTHRAHEWLTNILSLPHCISVSLTLLSSLYTTTVCVSASDVHVSCACTVLRVSCRALHHRQYEYYWQRSRQIACRPKYFTYLTTGQIR